MNLGQRTAALKARLDAKRGVTTIVGMAPRSSTPNALRYKVMEKMFAILSVKGAEWVVLKCDEHLVDLLKAQYAGIGHRTHLDPRRWICVALDADVPEAEIERLADHSYDLVCSELTRKQQADLRGEAA